MMGDSRIPQNKSAPWNTKVIIKIENGLIMHILILSLGLILKMVNIQLFFV